MHKDLQAPHSLAMSKEKEKDKERRREKDGTKHGLRKFLRSKLIFSDRKKEWREDKRQRENIKTVLFTLAESEIAVYKAATDVPFDGSSSIHSVIKKNKSSLIAQGKLEIYQINSIFTYLMCGSVIHPILPSCQMIKINSNTFIIPIKNPLRYWRLTLNTENEEVVSAFQEVVQSMAKLEMDLLTDYTLSSPFCTLLDNTNITSASSVTLKSFIHIDSDEDADNSDSNDLEDFERVGNGDGAEGPSSNYPLTIHQPVPIRPSSVSTSSLNSSIEQLYDSDTTPGISLLYEDSNIGSDAGKASEIHAISESTEIPHNSGDEIDYGAGNDDTNTVLVGDRKLSLDLDPGLDLDLDLDLMSDLDSDLDIDLSLDLQDSLNLNATSSVLVNSTIHSNNDLSMQLSDLRKGLSKSVALSTTSTMVQDILTKKEENEHRSRVFEDDNDDDLLCLWNDTGDGLTKRYSLSFKTYDKMPISIGLFDRYKDELKSVVAKSDSTGLFDRFLETL